MPTKANMKFYMKTYKVSELFEVSTFIIDKETAVILFAGHFKSPLFEL